MAKSKVLKKYDELMGDLDFSDEMNTPGDEVIAGFMSGLVEASNNQLRVAIELTKLIVEKSVGNMSEKDVFSVFKKATKVVTESVPLKEMWEKFGG
jgi:hypothetical protein